MEGPAVERENRSASAEGVILKDEKEDLREQRIRVGR